MAEDLEVFWKGIKAYLESIENLRGELGAYDGSNLRTVKFYKALNDGIKFFVSRLEEPMHEIITSRGIDEYFLDYLIICGKVIARYMTPLLEDAHDLVNSALYGKNPVEVHEAVGSVLIDLFHDVQAHASIWHRLGVYFT